MKEKLSEAFKLHWNTILDQTIDRTLIACSILGVFILPMTLYRSVSIGLYQEVIIHLLIFPVVLLATIFRKNIKFLIKVFIIFIPLIVITIAGLLSWGFIGAGISWTIISLLFVSVFFGSRFGILYAGLAIVILSLVGYLFVASVLHINLDINSYAVSSTSWVIYTITFAIHAAIIIIIVNSLYQAVKLLVTELEQEKVLVSSLASTDPLTEASNLRIARERIELSLARSSRNQNLSIYLIFIDLNDFKFINDTYGHSVGDQVLITVTKRLQRSMREEDMVARIGGDEFLVLVESEGVERNIDVILERLNSAIRRPISNEFGPIKPSASLGYALSKADNEDYEITTDVLIKAADKDMYLKKALYRKRKNMERRVT